MVTRLPSRNIVAGVLFIAAFAATFELARRLNEPSPRQVAFQVTGVPGTKVTGELEVDSVKQAAQEVQLPAEFACTARRVAFTVTPIGAPDLPISAVVNIDGVRRGVGTATNGVRVDVWEGHDEARFLAGPSEPDWKDEKGEGPAPELIGAKPAEWTAVEWINAERPRLADLKGKVALVRWFTGPICNNCVATAPALREFHERYSDLGFSVIGMYHHANDTVEEIQKIVEAYGFQFPVGIDRSAKTRLRWCNGRYDYHYTSVSFLLDRDGVIRYIHPGGEYVKGDSVYRALESQIEYWLAR